MLKIENVPYRMWNSRGSLADAKDGKRVMALMGARNEGRAGRSVRSASADEPDRAGQASGGIRYHLPSHHGLTR